MAQGFGYGAWFGVGVESTFGTAVSRTKFYEFDSEALMLDDGIIDVPSVRGVSASRTVNKKKDVNGNIEFAVGYESFEVLFKHALGTNNTTGSNPYTHTITLAQALPTGLSVEVNRDSANISGSSSWLYEGCQIDTLTLSQEVEKLLMASIELVGEDGSNVAVSTPSFATFYGVSWDHLAITIGGAAFYASGYDLKIANNLAKDRYALGTTRVRKGFGRSGPREVSGTIKGEFDSLTVSNYYRSQAALAVVFTYTSGSKTLTITLPNVRFSGKDPAVGSAGPIALELPFKARMSSAEGDEISVVFVNTVSSVP